MANLLITLGDPNTLDSTGYQEKTGNLAATILAPNNDVDDCLEYASQALVFGKNPGQANCKPSGPGISSPYPLPIRYRSIR